MLGLPGGGIYAANSPLVRSLEIYADREALRDDVTKYGGSLIVESSVGQSDAKPLLIYIGYKGSWKLEQKNAEVKRSIKKLLAESDFGLLGADYKKYAFTESDNQTVLLRLR
jgi:hypothetical protein